MNMEKRVKKEEKHEDEHGFPLPFLFFFLGFFFMLFIDQVLFYSVSYNPKKSQSDTQKVEMVNVTSAD